MQVSSPSLPSWSRLVHFSCNPHPKYLIRKRPKSKRQPALRSRCSTLPGRLILSSDQTENHQTRNSDKPTAQPHMKTKKHILLTFVLTLVAIFASPASAQTIPASLPISSKEMLTAFAVMQTAHGSLSHSSATMLYSNSNSGYVHKEEADLGKLLAKLSSTSTSFDVANTGDRISTYVTINDSQWGNLFWGNRSGQLQKVGSSWKLPSEPVTMHLSDYIRIPFAGAQWATLLVHDANGNITDWRNVETQSDSLHFQSALAGWGTELMVSYRDASGNFTQVAYSVKEKGKMIVPSNVTGITNVGIENVLFYDDATNSGLNLGVTMVATYNNQGTSGVSLLHARLDYTHNMTVFASATSSDVYGAPALKPTKFVIIQSQGGVIISESEFIAASNGSASFTLYPGTYEIIPIYPGEIFKQKVLPQQYFGSTDGGKG